MGGAIRSALKAGAITLVFYVVIVLIAGQGHATQSAQASSAV